MKTILSIIGALILVVIVAGAGVYFYSQESANVPIEATYGPNPQLAEPDARPIPTVNIAEVSSWPEGATPVAADGMTVNEFAGGLEHPRMLHVLPNGDVLVAESNRTKPEESGFGPRKLVMGLLMSQAGGSAKSANRISLLRDTDGDGVAETKTVFVDGLFSPFGMALIGDTFYVANTDSIVAYPYVEGEKKIEGAGKILTELPAGPINHHWTKDLVASPDGKWLYVGVGSNSNVGDNGLEAEEGRAAIWKVDPKTGDKELFATGLRNPNGLSINPDSGELWAVVNERDEIGSDLVPDYMTSVKEGGFYGWPFSYYGQHVDSRVEPQNPELVAKAIVPDYALGNHTGTLGLTFDTGDLFSDKYKNGAFVGQHGSWNRKPRSGYKVIFVPFADGKPAGQPQDILTGFIGSDDKAQGRPVGVAINAKGALLVADDVGNKVWRVAPEASSAALN